MTPAAIGSGPHEAVILDHSDPHEVEGVRDELAPDYLGSTAGGGASLPRSGKRV